MLIQITKEKFIKQKDIIGVFDLDTSTISGITKSFLSKSEKNNKTIGINTLPKSFILVGRAAPGAPCKNYKIYFSREDYKIYFSANMTGHIEKSGLSEK